MKETRTHEKFRLQATTSSEERKRGTEGIKPGERTAIPFPAFASHRTRPLDGDHTRRGIPLGMTLPRVAGYLGKEMNSKSVTTKRRKPGKIRAIRCPKLLLRILGEKIRLKKRKSKNYDEYLQKSICK